MPDQALFMLVEDSADDVLLTKRALIKGNVLNPLKVVNSGEEAILYLRGEGTYSNRAEFPLPAIVLLDLKLPGKDGFEVLEWIRSQPGFRNIRVIVLTSSESVYDVDRAYKMGANSFLTKPVEFTQLVEMMQAVKGYWLWFDKAPPLSRPSRTRNKQLPSLGQ